MSFLIGRSKVANEVEEWELNYQRMGTQLLRVQHASPGCVKIQLQWRRSHETMKTISNTRPKMKFPTCPVSQNVTFPHISYTCHLAEDRATFRAKEETWHVENLSLSYRFAACRTVRASGFSGNGRKRTRKRKQKRRRKRKRSSRRYILWYRSTIL